jgi:hypothetical protein
VDGGISILQYADDTILFMEHDLEKVLNMKLVLCIFEQLSGLKINFHKSEFFFGKAKEVENEYKIIFGCDKVLSHLNISKFQFICVSLKMENGNR